MIALSTSRASKEMKRVCDETSTYESLIHNETQSQVRPKKNTSEDLLDEVLSIAQSFEDDFNGSSVKTTLCTVITVVLLNETMAMFLLVVLWIS